MLGLTGELRREERRRGGLAGIEGLRAIAALTVVGYHISFVPADHGPPVAPVIMHQLRYGLVLFFVLSGFLLFRPIAKAVLEGRELPDVRRYARNRALRILPAYWVILLLTAFVLQAAVVTFPAEVGALDEPDKLLASVLLIQNYSTDWLYTGITPAWSLAVELVFYVALPFLGLLSAWLAAGSRNPQRQMVAALAPAFLLLGLGLATRAVIKSTLEVGSDAAILIPAWFPCQADLFGLGMVAAVLHVRPPSWRVLHPRWLLAGATVAVLLAVGNEPDGTDLTQVHNVVVGAACAAVVLAVTGTGTPRLTRWLEARWLVAVGLASYSLYLWHVPVIARLQLWGLSAESFGGVVLVGALVLAVVIPLSVFTYLLVERPAMRRRAPAVGSLETHAPAP